MTSPFPGMDPWLEDPSEWSGFHDILVVETVRLLQPQLRARGYYAKPDHPIVVQQAEMQIHESFVEIFDRANSRLVTGIEFVSPTNKSDAQGRELYQRKQREMRDAGIHLVEIDLIRYGPFILDIPEEVVEAHRPWDYLVNLVRRSVACYEFYPILLRNRLPRLRIPLRIGDADAVLDLQGVVDVSYDLGPYPERLVYQSNPFPSLRAEDAAWVDQILRSKGLRP